MKMSNMYRSFVFLILLYGFSHNNSITAQDTCFVIYGKMKIANSNPDDALIIVKKDYSETSTYGVGQYGEFEFRLSLNSEYLLTFTKEGYVTKQILISTILPSELFYRDFDPLRFNVNLFEQKDNNELEYNNPVAEITYNNDIGIFDYVIDYTIAKPSEIKEENIAEEKSADKEEKEIQKQLLIQQQKIAKARSNNDERKYVKDQNVLSKIYPNRKTVQFIEEADKRITLIIMNENRRINFYKKVVHKWGGIFYFKGNVSISEAIFEQETQ